MTNEGAAAFKYDISQVNAWITDGDGGAARAIRGWIRQKRIEGFRQREKNAKYRFSAGGVVEAWSLWAAHKGKDPAADMPEAVRKLQAETESVHLTVGANAIASPDGPTVTVLVPPGVSVKVVTVAA